jgi:hypothetical protein
MTENWDLPDTLDTSHHPTTAEQTENWDDGFEVETWNSEADGVYAATTGCVRGELEL